MHIPHITIHVRDIEKSIAFYQTVTGITIQRDLRSFGSPIVFMADDASSTCVELIAHPEAAFQGSGISIGFRTDDVQGEYARMQSLGLTVSEIISPNPRTHFFYVTDPDGVKVQLIGA